MKPLDSQFGREERRIFPLGKIRLANNLEENAFFARHIFMSKELLDDTIVFRVKTSSWQASWGSYQLSQKHPILRKFRKFLLNHAFFWGIFMSSKEVLDSTSVFSVKLSSWRSYKLSKMSKNFRKFPILLNPQDAIWTTSKLWYIFLGHFLYCFLERIIRNFH